jgi:hypothetical protein
MSDVTTTLGGAFAEALAAKDWERVRDLLHPEVDFRGLTPRRVWDGDGGPDAIVSGVLRQWFEDADEIEALVKVETDAFADRERVGYRFAVTNPDGRFLVEQQAYVGERDGRIGWLRIVCSGFRPAPAA